MKHRYRIQVDSTGVATIECDRQLDLNAVIALRVLYANLAGVSANVVSVYALEE